MVARLGSFLLALLLGALPVRAAVECARLFTDHLVLQRDRPAPVWGTADPGEPVIVEFAGQRHETVADAAGRWRVTLAPLAASFEPRALAVRGAANALVFSDVLVGEVWFCSGQSNMEKPVGAMARQRPTTDHELDLLTAHQPALRLFNVPRTDRKQDEPAQLRWLPTTPAALRDSRFSAAAYHFGRVLQHALGVPVGLIHASFGGTRIEAWMPAEAFADPELAGLDKQTYPAWVQGVQPTELFATMVRPCAPYALRGFLWYQGETNLMANDTALYARKQSALIAAWRRAWESPDAAFLGVLLPPFIYSTWDKLECGPDSLAAFREAQRAALSAPGTGFVVIDDLVDDVRDIHPVAKRGVGERLARLALHDTYGHRDLAARGPAFASLALDGATAAVTFDHAARLLTRDGTPPRHFLLAGADRVFRPATAKIDGRRVLLSHPEVALPVAVRFGWDETARPNLINEAELPAVPFRTDDWPLTALRRAEAGPGTAP